MMIIVIIPPLESPTILITPNSNVFVSTLTINREYISNILSITNKRTIISKINPRNSMALEKNCI